MRSRVLAWAVLLSAALLYFLEHRGMVDLSLSVAYREAPWPLWRTLLPRGGLAPWLIVAGSLAGAWVVASLTPAPVPFAVSLGVGVYACLVLPAHALELLSWAGSRPLFLPWNWAAAVWALAALLLIARQQLCMSAQASGESGTGAERRPDRLRPWLLAAAVAVACLYGESLGRTIRHGPRAWDSHSYHVPVPLQWIHLGSLTEPLVRQVIYGRLGLEKFANPGNGHLLMTLPLLVHWNLLAYIVQLPFVFLAAWAVASVARGAGATPGAAALASLALVSCPMLANQASVPILDLATAALSLAALAMLLARAEGEEPPPAALLALSGLAFGLGLGTKTTAWAHFPLLAVAFIASRWLFRTSAREVLKRLVLFAAAAALPSAFWYARSALLFGNPLYPIGVRVLGLTLIKGTTAELMSGYWENQMGIRSRLGWLFFAFRDPAYFEETGVGALFVPLTVLGLAMAPVHVASSLRDRRLTPRGRLVLLVAVALLVFWFAAARTPRFNIPLLGLAAALAAPAVDALGAGLGRHLVGLFALASCLLTLQVSVKSHGWDLGPPEDRAWELVKDFPGHGGYGIPPGMDALPPSVIFNDTEPEMTSQASNYNLFGADDRHLVYDHRGFASDDPVVFVSSLRALGVDYVFLRIPNAASPPARYTIPALEPLLRWEGREFRSTVYRLTGAREEVSGLWDLRLARKDTRPERQEEAHQGPDHSGRRGRSPWKAASALAATRKALRAEEPHALFWDQD